MVNMDARCVHFQLQSSSGIKKHVDILILNYAWEIKTTKNIY